MAASSASYDMHAKKPVYARNGVQEYLLYRRAPGSNTFYSSNGLLPVLLVSIVLTYERRIYWYRLAAGSYEEIKADAAGILRSQVFPGLWLQPAALWQANPAALLAVLHEGIASAEHTAFVEQLTQAGE